jgi:hypothetical protein
MLQLMRFAGARRKTADADQLGGVQPLEVMVRTR